MDSYVIILRIIHIGTGVFWAGATFFIVSFLLPTVQASGPEGGRFMQRLAQSPYPRAISGMAILNILSGLLLYWRDSAGLQNEWIGTPTGLALTIGGLAAILAFALGFVVARPASERMGSVAKAVADSGGPPTPAQMAEIQQLQVRLTNGARWTAYLLTAAVLAMAAARSL